MVQAAQLGTTYSSSVAKSRATLLEAELSAIRQLDTAIAAIRKVKARFPKLFEELKEELQIALDEKVSSSESKSSLRETPDSEDEETGIEKLLAFFRSRDNEPATIQEMAEACDRSKITIKNIIYRRHKSKFESIEKRGRNNKAYYRLTDG